MIKSFFGTLKEMFFSAFGLPIMTFKVHNHSLYYYDKESNELEYFSYKNKVVTFPSDYKSDIIYFEGYKFKKLGKEKNDIFWRKIY